MLLIIGALLLIVPALGQDHRDAAAAEEEIFPLNMANNAVDDQYYGCRKSMANLVKTKYLRKELKCSTNFSDAWKKGEKVFRKWKNSGKLKRDHKIAIHVYTGNEVYDEFNDDTRKGKQNYTGMAYKWHSLHFLLTEAITILKKEQIRCFNTFRGTETNFDGTVFTDIRFGSFTSSSLDRIRAAVFGSKSCFEIHTCEGAKVSKYSSLPEEDEVLIPPYEKFIVTEIKTRRAQPGLWCKKVFVLKSTGISSDLNCALFNKKTKTNNMINISDVHLEKTRL